MSHLLVLKLITAVTMFCSNYNHNVRMKQQCFKEIWACGHNVVTSEQIVFETHNCIGKYLKGKSNGKKKTK
jgi:hypothetical protein